MADENRPTLPDNSDDISIACGRGWVRHGDLKIGDLVFHPNGSLVRVRAFRRKVASVVASS